MKELWKKWCEEGLRWPYLHDPVSKKASVTLLFPYITFVIAVFSVIALHIWPNMILATGTSLLFWMVATIFYMLRKLSKAKFDLDSKSFELESKEESVSPDDLTGS
jgi:hypothetical protein